MSPSLSFFLYDYALVKLRIDGKHLQRYRLFLRVMSFYHRLRWPRVHFRIHTYPSDLIFHTQEVWSKRLKRPVSKEEALEFIRSFSNFVSLLREVRANAK